MSISVGSISSYLDATKQTTAGSELQKTLGQDFSSSSDEELMDVCKEFEAYFIEQVLKAMEKTIPKSEEDSSASKMVDMFKDNLIQDMAEQVGEQGGNSFAQMMYEQMKRNYNI